MFSSRFSVAKGISTGSLESMTTASCSPRDHIGDGSPTPIKGSAFHMYGVFGLEPNLSVKNDQNVVSLSRRRAPTLDT